MKLNPLARFARGELLFCCALLLLHGSARALDCPHIPEQARKDWEVEVRAAVGSIGPVKGAELATRTRSATRDLLGKLPQADKVYLEQMMYASYCSSLRDDSDLSESQKRERIKAYNLEVRKTLHAAPGKAAVGAKKFTSKDAARAELAGLPLPYTPDAFVESANKGELAVVKLFLAAGIDPNAKNQDGYTALMVSADKSHAKIIEALLKAKANVNERDNRDGTALRWAASRGQVSAVQLLLPKTTDAKVIDDAFLTAASFSHLELLRILLKRGADKRLVSQALIRVAGPELEIDEASISKVILFLLEQGADINAHDDDGWTALMGATKAGLVPTVQTLLAAGANVNAKCICEGWLGGGWTALMMAARESDKKAIVDMLLARGADPNLANNDGQTSLLIALDHGGGTDTVRALLDRGASVNAKDKEGKTPLMEAQKSYDAEIWRLLLEKHADVNAKDNQGSTALIWASAYGQVAGVEVLLDAGADIHAKTVKGRTVLMLAILNGQPEVVQTLLRKGAKLNDEDAIGKTPLNYAEEDLEGKARTEMLRILNKAGAK